MPDEIRPKSAQMILEDADKRSFDEMCGVSQREFIKSSLRSLLAEVERRMPDVTTCQDEKKSPEANNERYYAIWDCKQVLHEMSEEINKL